MKIDNEFMTARRSGHHENRYGDPLNPYEKDRARIIHSASFRRLQAKTNLLGIAEGDFHRTRLTHSLEVFQISRTIVRAIEKKLKNYPQELIDKTGQNDGQLDIDCVKSILPPLELIEAVSLIHDIGHPPFGHAGERALDFLMRHNGDDWGFEGNGQSLRLVTWLESNLHQDGKNFGLDLTRRTLLGSLKYPAPYSKVCNLDSQRDNLA